MWYQERDEGVLLFIKVVPNSSVNKIVGLLGSDFLKIKIAAQPAKGKANEALCRFLAEVFKIPKNAVRVVKGQTQTVKMAWLPVEISRVKRLLKVS